MEIGTLKELDVKPGDVVAWHKAAKGYECQNSRFSGIDDWVVRVDGSIWSKTAEDGFRSYCSHLFRIISRASDTPKLWQDMTDEEKGALLLAHHEGKVIEWNAVSVKTEEWTGWDECDDDCLWDERFSYRVKPEPVRETVTMDGADIRFSGFFKGHRITFDLIDGKPDCDSIKMEEIVG